MNHQPAKFTKAMIVRIIVFFLVVFLSPVALVASWFTMKSQSEAIEKLQQQNTDLAGKCFAVWVMDESAFTQLKSTDTLQLKLK